MVCFLICLVCELTHGQSDMFFPFLHPHGLWMCHRLLTATCSVSLWLLGICSCFLAASSGCRNSWKYSGWDPVLLREVSHGLPRVWGRSPKTESWRSLKDLTSGDLTDLDAWTTHCTGTSPTGKSQHNAFDCLHFQQGFGDSLMTAAALELWCWCLCVQFQGKRTVTTVQPALFIRASSL